jgi:HSP20 family molecular chaperone IbpA
MLRQERYAGSLQRSIKLPENIESSALRACLENGVLSITVGKPTLPVAHRIEIA